jgi:phospholipase/lecithinase/hemolysin
MSWPPSRLIVFGDSFSDVGNAHALFGADAVPSPPHCRGRRCNGPLWVERLAERLGLPALTESARGGSGHAHGGACSGSGLSPIRAVPNLLEQVERFLAALAGGPVDPEALLVLRAGANDYLTAPWPIGAACGEEINANLLAAVHTLADAGATSFLIPTELPWGWSPIVPAALSKEERAALNGLIAAQNGHLERALLELAAARGLRIVQPDLHGLFLEILVAPATFGFHNVTLPALPDQPGAEGFLWWDDRAHLTTAAHALIAARAHAALTGAEPV